jgi:hypothetical protein
MEERGLEVGLFALKYDYDTDAFEVDALVNVTPDAVMSDEERTQKRTDEEFQAIIEGVKEPSQDTKDTIEDLKNWLDGGG